MSLRVTFPTQLPLEWLRCCCWDWISVLVRLPCCLSTVSLKQDFIDIYLTTSFGVRNLQNTEAMRVNFFWKCWKFNVALKNAQKSSEKDFCFWDKCIWTGCSKLSLLRTQYLSSAVGMLTNSIKIFQFTKMVFFQLNYLHVMNEYGAGVAVEIESVFWSVCHTACRVFLSNGTF